MKSKSKATAWDAEWAALAAARAAAWDAQAAEFRRIVGN
jgi:hypothetical protein